jgi:hypothetical protein
MSTVAAPIHPRVAAPSADLDVLIEHAWLVRLVHLRREQLLHLDMVYRRHRATAAARFTDSDPKDLERFLDQRLNTWSRDRDLASSELERARETLAAFLIANPMIASS